MKSRKILFVALCVCLLGGALVVVAGPLDPPPGPVAPTNKTLAEVEPRIAVTAENTPGDAFSVFRITQPGSYYLAANVLGEPNKDGVRIESDNVTLDLNGFALIGAPDSNNGVQIHGAFRAIVVRNGTIRNWDERGVNGSVGVASAFAARYEDLVVRENGSTGFDGLSADANAIVIRCNVTGSGGDGVDVGEGSVVSETVAIGNGGAGILTGSRSIVDRCTVRFNSDNGIRTLFRSTIVACAAANNGGFGISVRDGSVVRGCSASQNSGGGIEVENGCLVESNACNGNSSNTDSIAGITAVGSGNRIVGNVCQGNGGVQGFNAAGIRLIGGANTVEQNTCVSNDTGIAITCGSLVVRNSCAANSVEYSVPPGLGCDLAGLPRAKVGTITSDPATAGAWDNFDY